MPEEPARPAGDGLAITVERLWVLLIPLVTLLLPLARIAPPIYTWQIERQLWSIYSRVRKVDEESENGLSIRAAARLVREPAVPHGAAFEVIDRLVDVLGHGPGRLVCAADRPALRAAARCGTDRARATPRTAPGTGAAPRSARPRRLSDTPRSN